MRNQRICHEVVPATWFISVSTCPRSPSFLHVHACPQLSGLNRAKTPPLLIAVVIVLQLRMAWTSTAKRFAVREGEIYSALAAFNRWDEIDDSEEWQRRIYYALSLSYALVSLVALVRTFLIFFRFLAFSMYSEST